MKKLLFAAFLLLSVNAFSQKAKDSIPKVKQAPVAKAKDSVVIKLSVAEYKAVYQWIDNSSAPHTQVREVLNLIESKAKLSD